MIDYLLLAHAFTHTLPSQRYFVYQEVSALCVTHHDSPIDSHTHTNTHTSHINVNPNGDLLIYIFLYLGSGSFTT